MTSSPTHRYPGQVDTAYPEPFNQTPPPVTSLKEGQLPHEQIKQFFDEGYLVVKDFFTEEELNPCRDDIETMVDNLAIKLYNAGKVKSLYQEYGLFQRLTKLEEDFQGANVLLFKFQKMPVSFQKLLSNPRILNLMEQILGPEIAGHPIWNLRTKTPFSEAINIPWHQDCGYFSNDSYDHMIASAWIPFLDATPENGCLQMARYGHKTGRVATHECCAGPTWYIMLEEEKMKETLGVNLEKDIVTTPVPYGGFVLFSNLIPHRSLPNISNDIRWSVDLRWQSPHHSYGFYDIQDGILLRSADQPNLEPNWQKFLSVDRKEVWQKRYSKVVAVVAVLIMMVRWLSKHPYYQGESKDPEFDTRITGPWIGKWEVVNHNTHTGLFQSITQA